MARSNNRPVAKTPSTYSYTSHEEQFKLHYGPAAATTLGAYIRRWREAQSMSREHLAHAIGDYVERLIEDLESDAALPTRLTGEAWHKLKECLDVPAPHLFKLIVEAMQPGAVKSAGITLPRMARDAEPEERVAFLSAAIAGLDEVDAEGLREIEAALLGDTSLRS